MSKHQTRNLLLAILTCLGWAMAQPALAADMKTASTFSKSFADARKAGNKTFEWNGKIYSTVKKTAKGKSTVTAKAKTAPKAEVKAAEAVATPVAATAPAVTPVPLVATTTLVSTPTPAPVSAAAQNNASPVPPFVFAPIAITPSAPAFVANTPTPWSPRPNPYIVQPVTVTVAPAPAAFPWQAQSSTQSLSIAQTPTNTASPIASGQGNFNAKDSGKSRSILPTITKVYPTGEKPMVVITFNCPTELAGIATPSTKILHGVFDLGFGAINATDLLPWTLQQVCS